MLSNTVEGSTKSIAVECQRMIDCCRMLPIGRISRMLSNAVEWSNGQMVESVECCRRLLNAIELSSQSKAAEFVECCRMVDTVECC
jgi:hypothetical protein